MKRADMVRQGTTQLLTAENAVEAALCEVTTLTSTLSRLRLDSNLSMVIGQDAMSALVETITLLSNARGTMVRAHGHLDEVKTQLGCRHVMTGQTNKPGEGGEGVTQRGDLVVVGDKRSAA